VQCSHYSCNALLPEFGTHLMCQSLWPPLIKSFKITANLVNPPSKSTGCSIFGLVFKKQNHIDFTIIQFFIQSSGKYKLIQEPKNAVTLWDLKT
jgi:hypothetical protein